MSNVMLNIDFSNWDESKISISNFIILAILHDANEVLIDKLKAQPHDFYKIQIEVLEQQGYIKLVKDVPILREKAVAIFGTTDKQINFDEFWEAFPTTTPSGRLLRAVSKEWGGKLTRDYSICRTKYLKKIKVPAFHDKIVSALKARVKSGDYEYMNNIETYINQEKWQQDVKYLKVTSTDINEMS
jgi:hypothetical protein